MGRRGGGVGRVQAGPGNLYAKMCALAGLEPAEVLYGRQLAGGGHHPSPGGGASNCWVRREAPEVARWNDEARADYEVGDIREVGPLVDALLTNG